MEFHCSDWCIFECIFGCPAVVFLDRRYPSLWDFYSTVHVDVVRAKAYVDCLFYSTRVEMGIMFDKIYFVPVWVFVTLFAKEGV